MQITLGEIIANLIAYIWVVSTITGSVALGIYIMRRTLQCTINQTYIIEDNCFCEDESCCEWCPMQEEYKEKCCKKEEKKD